MVFSRSKTLLKGLIASVDDGDWKSLYGNEPL